MTSAPSQPRLSLPSRLARRRLIADARRNGVPVYQVMADFDVSRTTVVAACREFGVKAPPTPRSSYFRPQTRVPISHVDGIPMRPCVDCTRRAGHVVLKPVEEFRVNKNPASRCGRSSYCVECERARDRRRLRVRTMADAEGRAA